MKLSFKETVYEIKPKSISKRNERGFDYFTEDFEIFKNGTQIKDWVIQKETVIISDTMDNVWFRVQNPNLPLERMFETNEEITLSDFINILNVMNELNLDKRLC